MHEYIMSTKAERISQAMRYYSESTNKKMNWHLLSMAVGKSASAPTNWKKNRVSDDVLKKIADHLGVNYLWLLTNTGTIIDAPPVFAKFLFCEVDTLELQKIGELFLTWQIIYNQSGQLQQKVVILTEKNRAKPNLKVQEEIIQYQKELLASQEKSQRIYMRIMDMIERLTNHLNSDQIQALLKNSI